jgi:hypothetical protein
VSSTIHAAPRRVALLVAALLVCAFSLLTAPSAATAQDAPTPDETSSTPVPTPHIIPEPNSGHKPIDAGDRGGALQLLLLAVLVVAVGGIALHLVRESRRARSGSR